MQRITVTALRVAGHGCLASPHLCWPITNLAGSRRYSLPPGELTDCSKVDRHAVLPAPLPLRQIWRVAPRHRREPQAVAVLVQRHAQADRVEVGDARPQQQPGDQSGLKGSLSSKTIKVVAYPSRDVAAALDVRGQLIVNHPFDDLPVLYR